MNGLPSLDLHAHVDPDISPNDLEDLGGIIFAVTRSLAEAKLALRRHDLTTIWGVGCHPGVAAAQADFSKSMFSELVDHTPFVGELGLDGKSRVPLALQRSTLRSALEVLAEKPRIVSLHSYAATEMLIDELEATPVKGIVLHWWLGSSSLTERASRLGCYFSMNGSSTRKARMMADIPTDRLLAETDHPFGDRRSRSERAPGRVGDVERAVASREGLTITEARLLMWRNLDRLVQDVNCAGLFPRKVRSILAAIA